MKPHRPQPPGLFTAGTQSVRGRGHLGGLVLLLLARDFDDQVQEIVDAVAVVDRSDEVGDVVVLFAVDGVGDREARGSGS